MREDPLFNHSLAQATWEVQFYNSQVHIVAVFCERDKIKAYQNSRFNSNIQLLYKSVWDIKS